MFSGEDDA